VGDTLTLLELPSSEFSLVGDLDGDIPASVEGTDVFFSEGLEDDFVAKSVGSFVSKDMSLNGELVRGLYDGTMDGFADGGSVNDEYGRSEFSQLSSIFPPYPSQIS
jgi:hypothetical protein